MGLVGRLLERGLGRLEAAAQRFHEAELAKLTPAERERHDLWEARAAAAGAAVAAGLDPSALPDARLTTTVLQGPAGEAVHGITKRPRTRDVVEDPRVWDERCRTEQTERAARREAYLAPGRHPVAIDRVVTRGHAQVPDLSAHLAASGLAARPDLVFGVSRVPDLLTVGRLGLGGERRGVVEWAVVHAGTGVLPPSAPPAVLSLDARDRLVDRAVGAQAPLDEDVAIGVLCRAGIGPERTIGVARNLLIAIRGGGEEGGTSIDAVVRGAHVLVADGDGGALDAAGRDAPWRIPAGAPEGVVVDVLQWDAIAQAVHPVRQRRPPMPSPFPYLPLTADELLRSYLEIVGVAPTDAYAAQVTHDRPFDLMGRSSARAGVRRTGGGPELPCADGTPRRRMTGGHHVVVAYRDRPAYATGRERFDAYAEQELQAHLRRGLHLRPPLPKPEGRLLRAVDRVATVADFVSGEYDGQDADVPPRYCWPPARG